jgi:hypothetical protein
MPRRLRVESRAGADRRLLWRVSALLCLALAFSCLVAAGVGLGAEVAGPIPARSLRSPGYLLPVVTAVFLLVVGSLLRSRHSS